MSDASRPKPAGARRPYPDEVWELNDPTPVASPLAKLVVDKVLALLLLALTSPLWVIITVAELVGGLIDRDDAGPVFYHEIRVSAGEEFRLTKFRILKMRAIREEIDKGVTPKAVENRPKNLTKVGKVLKKTGLDELPQFFLVLKGDMSLVGPRPKPVPEYAVEIDEGIWRRQVIRAGLTGPAQLLKGTQRTRIDDLLVDLRYIERHRSDSGLSVAGHDLVLLGRTVWLMLKFTGE